MRVIFVWRHYPRVDCLGLHLFTGRGDSTGRLLAFLLTLHQPLKCPSRCSHVNSPGEPAETVAKHAIIIPHSAEVSTTSILYVVVAFLVFLRTRRIDSLPMRFTSPAQNTFCMCEFVPVFLRLIQFLAGKRFNVVHR